MILVLYSFWFSVKLYEYTAKIIHKEKEKEKQTKRRKKMIQATTQSNLSSPLIFVYHIRL